MLPLSFSLEDRTRECTNLLARKRYKDPMNRASLLTQADWQRALTNDQARAAELFGRPEAEQKRLGYFHTLREICQQPWTWLHTCDRMMASRERLRQHVAGIRSLVLTGSGSSEYAAQCVCLPLQNELGISTESISGGALLMYGGGTLSLGRPGLLVSLAGSVSSINSRAPLLSGLSPDLANETSNPGLPSANVHPTYI